MATGKELLASSFEVLRAIAKDGVVRSSEISRTHRERLIQNGFLMEVAKGWLVVTNPSIDRNSSTTWHVSSKPFISRYLSERFGDGYCLSAEASIRIHAGSTIIPKQLTVITKAKGMQTLELPFGTSLLMYQDEANFPAERINRDGLWIMELPAALCRVPPAFYRNSPQDAEIALRMVRSSSLLLEKLLEKGSTSIAGRLAGAYKFLGEAHMADGIASGMMAAGHKIRLSNPFEVASPALASGTRIVSPHASRIETLWRTMREAVLEIFPEAPGIVTDMADYLRKIDKLYVNDAYNSLSIEGYQVTSGLIERIRDGKWNSDAFNHDRMQRDAMAAKGYNLAFQSVKRSIRKILEGNNPADVVNSDHRNWYLQMLSPSVQAGLLKPSDLAGYRNAQVYIQNSGHVPPPREAVPDCMETFFGLMNSETSPAVRAVLGHFIFVYIHPYPDGNGRIARFLMNSMLASGGYPWTIVRLETRNSYMDALEEASARHQIAPFAQFIKAEMLLCVRG